MSVIQITSNSALNNIFDPTINKISIALTLLDIPNPFEKGIQFVLWKSCWCKFMTHLAINGLEKTVLAIDFHVLNKYMSAPVHNFVY
jgi:hypothetical protein